MWIARDKNGELYLYARKPIKKETIWSSDWNCEFLQDKINLFREVHWEDEEPTKIKLVKDK